MHREKRAEGFAFFGLSEEAKLFVSFVSGRDWLKNNQFKPTKKAHQDCGGLELQKLNKKLLTQLLFQLGNERRAAQAAGDYLTLFIE